MASGNFQVWKWQCFWAAYNSVSNRACVMIFFVFQLSLAMQHFDHFEFFNFWNFGHVTSWPSPGHVTLTWSPLKLPLSSETFWTFISPFSYKAVKKMVFELHIPLFNPCRGGGRGSFDPYPRFLGHISRKRRGRHVIFGTHMMNWTKRRSKKWFLKLSIFNHQ